MTTTKMDGYEYERKVLFPMWNKEIREREEKMIVESKNASSSMKERLKNELGIEIKEQRDLSSLGERMLKNPDNFYPELSPDYEFIKSTRKSRWG
jgi:tRNA U54 and U55 pseudouridine synthase Pus10